MRPVFSSAIICLLVSLVSKVSVAQVYIPLPDTTILWTEVYRHSSFEPYTRHFYQLSTNDTVINGTSYRKLYRSDDTIFTEPENASAIRQDTGLRRVYLYNYQTTLETLLYDFSVGTGDTLVAGNTNWFTDMVVHSVDSMLIDGQYRRRINLRLADMPQVDILPSAWVEGVGNVIRGVVFPSGTLPNNGMWNELLCMSVGGVQVYQDTTDWYTHDLSNLSQDFPDCGWLLQSVHKPQPSTSCRLYPNPLISESNLELSPGQNWTSLTIYNSMGQYIARYPVTDCKVLLHRKDFSPGVYFLRIANLKGACRFEKMVVQ